MINPMSQKKHAYLAKPSQLPTKNLLRTSGRLEENVTKPKGEAPSEPLNLSTRYQTLPAQPSDRARWSTGFSLPSAHVGVQASACRPRKTHCYAIEQRQLQTDAVHGLGGPCYVYWKICNWIPNTLSPRRMRTPTRRPSRTLDPANSRPSASVARRDSMPMGLRHRQKKPGWSETQPLRHHCDAPD